MTEQPIMPVLGSEIFASRPVDPGTLRSRISDRLRLHTVEPGTPVDPLTYEVIRHRIWSITDEMGETLKRMSGSPGVTEANDFDFAICDELGQEVQVGLYNTGLVASIDYAIQWTLQNRADNPGIEPGDMFLLNDPWVGGGLHQNDAAILAPLFVGDELFGWTASTCHLIDIGGAKPGSANLSAGDVFTEAVPTPPIKLVRGGEMQLDVLQAFIRRSRMPILVNLDINAEIAANRVGHDRITRLVDRYGAATVKAVMKRMMDDAESRLRERLRSVPDGEWSSTGYIEGAVIGDRALRKIELTVRKTEDRLQLDFTGTDPQGGAVNCPYTGMRAGVMFALLPMLAGDIPWCPGGLMRTFDLISEPGTIVDATFPSAVGVAPLSAAWEASNLVAECFGRMMDVAADSTPRVQAGCTGAFDMVTLAGVDQRGAPVVSILFDTMAGGYGARPSSDGCETAGVAPIPQGRAPDVEMTEFLNPCLYLWRREQTDSGGPGTYRGGQSISICLVPHKTPAPLAASFFGNGKGRPAVPGLAGGYPGGPQVDLVARGSAARALLSSGTIPSSLSEIGGDLEIVPSKHETLIGPADALFLHPSGGGGYGDPLLRDPRSVTTDVRDGRVSVHVAGQVYGVVLTDGEPDLEETRKRRAELRSRRAGSGSVASPVPETGGTAPQGQQLNSALVVSDGAARCVRCGSPTGSAADPYADSTIVRGPVDHALDGVEFPSELYTDDVVQLTQWACPGCATLLRTVVTAERQEPVADPAL